MTDIFKEIPKWLLAVAFSALVMLLVLSLFIGQPFYIYGQEFGFRQKPAFLKGWTFTPPHTAVQNETVSLGVKPEEGVCFLTYVSGAFEGGGQQIEVIETGGMLALRSFSDLKNTGITAKARCIRFVESAVSSSK
jgi:hypothetical protein